MRQGHCGVKCTHTQGGEYTVLIFKIRCTQETHIKGGGYIVLILLLVILQLNAICLVEHYLLENAQIPGLFVSQPKYPESHMPPRYFYIFFNDRRYSNKKNNGLGLRPRPF